MLFVFMRVFLGRRAQPIDGVGCHIGVVGCKRLLGLQREWISARVVCMEGKRCVLWLCWIEYSFGDCSWNSLAFVILLVGLVVHHLLKHGFPRSFDVNSVWRLQFHVEPLVLSNHGQDTPHLPTLFRQKCSTRSRQDPMLGHYSRLIKSQEHQVNSPAWPPSLNKLGIPFLCPSMPGTKHSRQQAHQRLSITIDH